jgi:8-oxo-dGTP diphosphatase
VLGQRAHPQTGRTLVYVAAGPVLGTAVRVAAPAELTEVRWASSAEAGELPPGMLGPVRAYLAEMIR